MESLPLIATGSIAFVTTTVEVFTAGLLVSCLAGVLLYHCIIKHQARSSNLESSSHQHQETEPSSNTLQQADPQYEEVMELRQNTAYQPTQIAIEMRPNEAYESIQL